MTPRELLLGRFKWTDAKFQPIKTAMEAALDARDAVRAEHAKIAADTRLTGEGRRDATRAFVADKPALAVRLARASAERVRGKLKAAREKLAPPKPDKTDLAAAVMRSELRGMLRAMTASARIAAVLSPNADDMLLQSVLDAPNVATGIDQETRERVYAAAVERAHPGELAKIQEVEDALELLDAAVGVAVEDMRSAAGFPDKRALAEFLDASTKERAPAIETQASQWMEQVAA